MDADKHDQRRTMDWEETEYFMRHGQPGGYPSDPEPNYLSNKYSQSMTFATKKQNVLGNEDLSRADKRGSLCDMAAVPEHQIPPTSNSQNNAKPPGTKRRVSGEGQESLQIRSRSVPPSPVPPVQFSGDRGQHGHSPALTMSSSTRQMGVLGSYLIAPSKKRKRVEGSQRLPRCEVVIDLISPSRQIEIKEGQLIDQEKNELVPEILSSQRLPPTDLCKIKYHASKRPPLISPNEEEPRRYAHEDVPAPSTPKTHASKRGIVLSKNHPWASHARFNGPEISAITNYKDTAKGVTALSPKRSGKPNNMPIPGGIKPRNDLSQGIHTSLVVGKEKAFNLKAPYQISNTKQKIEPGLSGPTHRDVIKIDSDPVKQRGRDISGSQSQRSNTHHGYSVGGGSRNVSGHVDEMRNVEKILSTRPSRGSQHRKRKSSQQGSNIWESPGSNGHTQDASKASKRTILRYNRTGEIDDPEDPIEDDDSHVNRVPRKAKFDSLKPRISSSIDGKRSHKIKAKESDDELGNSGGTKASQLLNEGGRSRYFLESNTGAKRQKINPSNGERSYQLAPERDDSVSDDELARSQMINGESKQKETVPNSSVQHSSLAQPEHALEYSLESSEDDNRVKSDIRRTNFTSTKLCTPRKNKHVAQYEVLKAFTPSRWLWNNPSKPCKLLYNRNERVISIFRSDDDELKIPLNKINKILYTQDTALLSLETPQDMGPDKVDRRYFFCLKSIKHTTELVNSLGKTDRKVFDMLEKPDNALINAFNKAEGNIKIQDLLPKASIEKANYVFSKALEDKKTLSSRKRTIEQVKPDTNVETQRASRPRLQPSVATGISPSGFYGTRSQDSRSSPSSGRAIGSARRHNVPPPPETRPDSPERWTELNEDWERKWKSSIVWPPVGKNKATVDKADIPRLDEGQFLNDNLVMFYLYHLQHNLQNQAPEIFKRVYFHNSFFYERLTSSTKGSKRGINYEAVERWTAKVNLFAYDYIIVPVNEHTHWYVAIICNTPKFLSTESDVTNSMKNLDIVETAQFPSSQSKVHGDTEGRPIEIIPLDNDSQTTGLQTVSQQAVAQKPQVTKQGRRKSGPKIDPSEPRIIALDSLNMTHSPTCTNLKHYLASEAKSKLGVEVPVPTTIGLTVKNLPQQGNYCDCGLFLLGYVEKFLEDPDDFVRNAMTGDFPDDPTYWPDWKGMRTKVRGLLFELQQQQIIDAKKSKKVKKPKSQNESQPTALDSSKTTGQPTERTSEPPISSAPLASTPEKGTRACTAEQISSQDTASPAQITNHGLPIFPDSEEYVAPDTGGAYIVNQSQPVHSDIPGKDFLLPSTEDNPSPSVQDTNLAQKDEPIAGGVAESKAVSGTKSSRVRSPFGTAFSCGGKQLEAVATTVPSTSPEVHKSEMIEPSLPTTAPKGQPHQRSRYHRGSSEFEVPDSQAYGPVSQSFVVEIDAGNGAQTQRAQLRESTRNTPIQIDDDPNPTSNSRPLGSDDVDKEADNAEMLLDAGSSAYKGPSRLTTDTPDSSPLNVRSNSKHLAKGRTSMRSRGTMHRSHSRPSSQNEYAVDASDSAFLKGHYRQQKSAKAPVGLIDLSL